MKHQVTITILGTTLSLVTEDGEEHMEAVTGYFTNKITEIRNKIQSHDPLKTAILAGLNTADELVKLKALAEESLINQAESGDKEIDTRTKHMIDAINRALS